MSGASWRRSGAARRSSRLEGGFGSTEGVLLALTLGAMCILMGLKLSGGGGVLAGRVDGELGRGSPTGSKARPELTWNLKTRDGQAPGTFEDPGSLQPPRGTIHRPGTISTQVGALEGTAPLQRTRELEPAGELGGAGGLQAADAPDEPSTEKRKPGKLKKKPGAIRRPGTIQKPGTIQEAGTVRQAGTIKQAGGIRQPGTLRGAGGVQDPGAARGGPDGQPTEESKLAKGEKKGEKEPELSTQMKPFIGRGPTGDNGQANVGYFYHGIEWATVNGVPVPVGYSNGMGLIHDPKNNLDVLSGNLHAGFWTDADGKTNFGISADVQFAKFATPDGPIKGEFGVFDASIGAYGNRDSATIGAGASALDGAVTLQDDTRSARFGMGVGPSLTGRLHYGDTDGDGVPNLGLGADFDKFSIDVREEPGLWPRRR